METAAGERDVRRREQVFPERCRVTMPLGCFFLQFLISAPVIVAAGPRRLVVTRSCLTSSISRRTADDRTRR